MISRCSRTRAEQFDFAAGDAARHQQRARFEPVGHDLAVARGELVDAFDLDRGRARADHLRTHAVEERGEVGDLGLACRVLDHGAALGEDGRAHQVLGRADAGEFEDVPRAREAVGVRVHEAVLDLDARTHCFQPPQVHVDLAAADEITAGQRHPRFAAPGDERAEDVERGAHQRDQLVRRFRAQLGAGVDPDLVAGQQLDLGADRAQQVGHDLEVADDGHVVERGDAGREQRGGHLLGAGVLRRARDRDPAVERPARADAERRHEPSYFGVRCSMNAVIASRMSFERNAIACASASTTKPFAHREVGGCRDRALRALHRERRLTRDLAGERLDFLLQIGLVDEPFAQADAVRLVRIDARRRPDHLLGLAAPTTRGSRWVPPRSGRMPYLCSSSPTLAPRAKTRMSHASASCSPAPSA